MTATTSDEIVFPGSGRDRGLLGARQDARATAGHTAVLRPDRAHPRGGVHQGAGRVRLPDHGLAERDQPLLLRGVPPDPGRGRDRRPDDPLPRQAGREGARRRQDVGGGVEAGRAAPATNGQAHGGLLRPERRGARRQARRATRTRCGTSGGSTATSTSCCCRAARSATSTTSCMRARADPTESYQALQGFRHPFRRRAAAGSGTLSRHGQGQPRAAASCCATTAAGGDPRRRSRRPTRVGPSTPTLDAFLFEFGWRHDAVYDLADVPWREDPSIPLASIAGHDGPRRRARTPRSSTSRTSPRREEPAWPTCGRSWPTSPRRWPGWTKLYEAARLQLPAHRGPRLLHRPARHQRLPALRAGAGRPPGGEGRARRGTTTSSTSTGTRWSTRCATAATARAVAGGRRASLAQGGAGRAAGRRWATPPPPPEEADPFMDALVFRLLGMVPPEDNPDPNVLKGVAGSPGSLHRARPASCGRWPRPRDLEEGEVMVCEMTLPPWVPLFSVAGAIVADVGGVLSHTRHRGPRVRHAGRRRHAGRHDRHPDRPDHHRRRHARASSTSTAAPSERRPPRFGH